MLQFTSICSFAFCIFAAMDGTVNGLQIENIPSIYSDFSLVYLTHQFGFIVLIGIAALLLIFSAIAMHKLLKEKSVLGSIIALSILLTFIFQSVLYIANNLGVSPISSLPLPLISYGKLSLLVNSALIGFMLSVFRTGDVHRDSVVTQARARFFSYKDGKLIIDLRGKQI